MNIKNFLLIVPFVAVAISGCSHKLDMESRHEIKPIEIKPIHITIDINLKVDKALDDFFDDIDE